MKIDVAVRKCYKHGYKARRKSFFDGIYINYSDNYSSLMISFYGGYPSQKYTPSILDLIADDWEVCK